jgi:hypothetical protein
VASEAEVYPIFPETPAAQAAAHSA